MKKVKNKFPEFDDIFFRVIKRKTLRVNFAETTMMMMMILFFSNISTTLLLIGDVSQMSICRTTMMIMAFTF